MSIYETITAKILEQVDKGVAPWRKPWHAEPPANLMSKKAYRGINVILLAMQGYGSQYWLTFQQAKQLGGHVRAGEKSTGIVFWRFDRYTKHNQETQEDETRTSVLARFYNVFNVEQCEGLKNVPVAEPRQPIEACESILAGYFDREGAPKREQLAKAAYSPEHDVVFMPSKALFRTLEEFYGTYFHEMVHSTGHSSRLNRFENAEKRAFGSESYSKEELIAEFGNAMLCGTAGIEQATLENSAAYLEHWRKRLQDDPKLLVSAASAAQKACDLILAKTAKNVEEDAELATA